METKKKSLRVTPKSPTKSDELISSKHQAEAAELMLRGLSAVEIAKKMGFTVGYVHRLLKNQIISQTELMKERREIFELVNYTRSERLFNMLYEVVEKQVKADEEGLNGPDPQLIRLLLKIMEFQQNLLYPKGSSSNQTLHIHQQPATFLEASDLYETAIAIAQQNAVGEIHPANNYLPQFVEPDSRLLKLSDMANKFLPKGDLENADPSGYMDSESD